MPKSYTPKELKKALKKHGVNAVYHAGWDSSDIDPFGVSPSMGILMHHTANGGAKGNNPSLYWQVRNENFPVRAAHCNIGRDGLVTIIAARGAYHAGAGGPVKIGSGVVPYNVGNRLLYGIELESKAIYDAALAAGWKADFALAFAMERDSWPDWFVDPADPIKKIGWEDGEEDI